LWFIKYNKVAEALSRRSTGGKGRARFGRVLPGKREQAEGRLKKRPEGRQKKSG